MLKRTALIYLEVCDAKEDSLYTWRSVILMRTACILEVCVAKEDSLYTWRSLLLKRTASIPGVIWF